MGTLHILQLSHHPLLHLRCFVFGKLHGSNTLEKLNAMLCVCCGSRKPYGVLPIADAVFQSSNWAQATDTRADRAQLYFDKTIKSFKKQTKEQDVKP